MIFGCGEPRPVLAKGQPDNGTGQSPPPTGHLAKFKPENMELAKIIQDSTPGAFTEEQALQAAQVVRHLMAGQLLNMSLASKRLPESKYRDMIQRDIQSIRDLFNQ